MRKTRYARHLIPQAAPQTQPIPGREAEMILNEAGAYGFRVDDWQRLTRFLLIGSEGGTYYEGERALTLDNARAAERCLAEDGVRVVDEVVRISEAGLAPSNAPAIFVLALAASPIADPAIRAYALSRLPRVCRTASHLFEFTATVRVFRGWGRGLRRAVGAWYTGREPASLAYQLIKYRNRAGMTHRDLLRLAHVKPPTADAGRMLGWAAGKVALADAEAPVGAEAQLWAFDRVQAATDRTQVIDLVRRYRLPFEAVPYRWLAEADVWTALLPDLPYTALLRNLGRLTRSGVIGPMSDGARLVAGRLAETSRIRKARVHPLTVLKALKQYAAGRGDRGDLVWTPLPQIVDALNEAFYRAFDNVEPTGKNILIAIDVSGSMGAAVAGIPNLTASEAAAAVAMCYLRAEKSATVMAYDTGPIDLDLSPSMRLDDILGRVPHGGGTDCAIPARTATDRRWQVDGILMLTDSESWAGNMHAAPALDALRAKIHRPVRLVNVQATASGTSIHDPGDPLSLEMAGFGADIPTVAGLFFRGDL